jgi:hypothetical protein
VHLTTVTQAQPVPWSAGDATAVGSRLLLTSELLWDRSACALTSSGTTPSWCGWTPWEVIARMPAWP